MSKRSSQSRIVFDPIYGFIHLTPVEWQIIRTPFFQRLRWIKQLGFSCYVFPGAEHSRFGHAIGAMNNAHEIIKTLGLAVSDAELMADETSSEKALFHKSVRLAALLHDLGTFPFSHTTEESYIRHGETLGHQSSHNHEQLASFIIKNSLEENGITTILKKYGFDPVSLAELVRGLSPSILANQILHSEIDCDRMDYLLRDAYYTGLKYGTYDRTYLLHHFRVGEVAHKPILTISHNALHCVEDFLMARFAWYSQVIRSPRGARYDAVATELCLYLLQKKKIYSYQELLQLISSKPEVFYGFNDMYFLNIVHQSYIQGYFDHSFKMKELAEILLFQKPVAIVKCEELSQRILSQDEKSASDKVVKRAWDKIHEIEELIQKRGQENEWIVVDMPRKDIVFVKSQKQIVKNKVNENVLLERDPAKLSLDNGDVVLLGDVENSVISKLQNTYNFIPNVFCSEAAYALLVEKKIITSK
ncbi:MAG: HD domain-containing protein [Bacteriovoracaceae bacterium]|nr:HD domain-containing protein [Bacteriovoracaceae bacterium]